MDAESIKQKANRLFSQGLLQEAVDEYSLAIDLDSSNYILFGNRAQALIRLERWTAALEDCNRCLALKADFVKGLYRRAIVLSHFNKYEEALRDLESALVIEPQNKVIIDEIQRIKQERLKHPSTTASIFIPILPPSKSPSSSYHFQIMWRELAVCPETKVSHRSLLLQIMEQDNCLSFLKESMDPSFLSQVIEVLAKPDFDERLGRRVIETLQTSPEFDLDRMFLEPHETKVLQKYSN